MRVVFCIVFAFSISLPLFCQDSSSHAENKNEIAFDAEAILKETQNGGFLHENDGKKHWFTAVGGLLFWNVGLSTYNRFVVDAGWTKVGPEQWNHFWTRKLEWDNDWYWTNFVLHPYQGTIYYNVARSSNLNRIESFALTTVGTAMWEYLCETNAPSKNDIIYTTVGAFAVGEMLYRLSIEADEIHDALGILVNPTRMWTEIWTRQKPLGTHGNIHELSFTLALGNAVGYTDLRGYSGEWEKSEVYPFFFAPSLNVTYGNPFAHDSNDPYSQFELEMSGAIGKGSGTGAACAYASLDKKIFYQIRILSNGMLISRAPEKLNSEDVATTVGVVMEYDFDWHSYYLLSTIAPGIAIKQRREFQKNALEWHAHLAAILLGTSDFYYYRRNFDEVFIEKRDNPSRPYNFNIGAQTKLSAKVKNENGSSVFASFRGYAMYDFYNQLQEFSDGTHATHTGWDFVGILNLGAEFALNKLVKLGLVEEIYTKFATYRTLNDVAQIVNTTSAYCKLQAK